MISKAQLNDYRPNKSLQSDTGFAGAAELKPERVNLLGTVNL